MSEPTGARRYGTGGGDAYYDAVKYGGYEGTREQFGKDQAEFAQNAAAVAAAKEVVEQDTEEVRSTKETFVNTTVPDAIAAVQQEGADQVQAVTQQGEESSQQVETVGTEQKDAVANEGRARVQAVEEAGTTQVQAVNDAGTTQVGNVNQAGEDQVDAVEQTGANQVQAVTDEGTTQVGAVTGEGNTQVQRVQDKGDEVIGSIPADYTALDQKVNNSKSAIIYNNGIIHAAKNEITALTLYTAIKVIDGKIEFVDNPSGYWKTLIVPIENLYIDGVAHLTANYLQGNQSQNIPSMAFCDENYNVVGTPTYNQHVSPKTFQKADVPADACYVCFNGSTIFKFDFASTDSLLSDTLQLRDATSVLKGESIPLTFTNVEGYYNRDGSVTTYSGVSVARVTVTEGEQYLLTGRNYYSAVLIAFFNSNDAFIGYVWNASNDKTFEEQAFIVPANASYMLVQRLYAFPRTYLQKVTGRKLTPIKSILNGKKITVIGDSITEYNFRAKMNWALWITEWCGAIVQNLGRSGTGFHAGSTSNTNYHARIASIQASPDIIGVALSWNDLANPAINIGTITDTVEDNTVAGYANQFFDDLITAFPTTPIICYIQNPWFAMRYGASRSDTWANLLAEICRTKGVPFYADLYYGTVLKPWLADNRTVYFTSDNDDIGNTGVVDDTHPNSEGHKVIARTLYPLFAKNIVATGLDYFN